MWDEYSATWTCKHCGAIYDVQIKKSVVQAKEAQMCVDCGQTMYWHESLSPRELDRVRMPIDVREESEYVAPPKMPNQVAARKAFKV